MALQAELERIAAAALEFAEEDEMLAGVVPAEPAAGLRVYLCAYACSAGTRWLGLDGDGRPVESRSLVRDAVSIVALCEVAEETAAGGDLDELRSHLVALRITENPPGIDEAEDAVLTLQHTIGAPPRVATPRWLDEVGAATRRLEIALGEASGSPFAEAMKQAVHAVDALAEDVEANYKRPLG